MRQAVYFFHFLFCLHCLARKRFHSEIRIVDHSRASILCRRFSCKPLFLCFDSFFSIVECRYVCLCVYVCIKSRHLLVLGQRDRFWFRHAVSHFGWTEIVYFIHSFGTKHMQLQLLQCSCVLLFWNVAKHEPNGAKVHHAIVYLFLSPFLVLSFAHSVFIFLNWLALANDFFSFAFYFCVLLCSFILVICRHCFDFSWHR